MDEERWRRHHAAIARAHELIATADELLDECAIRAAARACDQPDALQAWAASMPPTPQPERVQQKEIRKMVARHEANQHARQDAETKAQLYRFMREQRTYRDNLEKALGKVIADQRKETAALRDEVTKLRAQIEAMRIAAASPPVRRLVQSQRTIGHAVSA